MALLKTEFLRQHPVQSGMVWAAGFAGLTLGFMWLTGMPIQSAIVTLLILCSIMGGLGWGYSMKAYHDRAESRR